VLVHLMVSADYDIDSPCAPGEVEYHHESRSDLKEAHDVVIQRSQSQKSSSCVVCLDASGRYRMTT
jgi:hypothetical protein